MNDDGKRPKPCAICAKCGKTSLNIEMANKNCRESYGERRCKVFSGVLLTLVTGLNVQPVQLVAKSLIHAVNVMVMGGSTTATWKDLKTMQRYIRLAAVEVKGATNCLKFIPESEAIGKVVDLFQN